jgi:hypothetical protein
MTVDTTALPGPRPRPRAELILAALGLLTFALIPLRINTVYEGLPAHPLFLHVPVILIPVATIGALMLIVRPQLFQRHGVWLAAVAVVALAATNLTIGAGKALRADLGRGGGAGARAGSGAGAGAGGFGGGDAALVAQHAHAADILRLLMILFTALLLVTVAAYRTADGSKLGIGFVDALLARGRSLMPSLTPVRILLAVLAIASLYYVFRTGDLGAKAVWADRLHGFRGGPGGFAGGGTGAGGLPGLFQGGGGAAPPGG